MPPVYLGQDSIQKRFDKGVYANVLMPIVLIEVRIGRTEDVSAVVFISGQRLSKQLFSKNPIAAQDKSKVVIDPFIPCNADRFGKVEIIVGNVACDTAILQPGFQQTDPDGRPAQAAKRHVHEQDTGHGDRL